MPRLATAYINTALVTLALPAVVLHAAGDARKGLHPGLVTACGALLSIGVLYASGSLEVHFALGAVFLLQVRARKTPAEHL